MPFSSKNNQGSLEKQLISGLKQEKYKMSLTIWYEMLKEEGDKARGQRKGLKAPTGPIWDNVSKVNNDMIVKNYDPLG